jgi:hypothetical protein
MLLAGRRTHSFPAEVREALAALLSTGELKAGDLPGIEPADRLVLARRLVTEAVATVPETGPPAGDARATRHDGARGDARGAGR